MNKLLSFLTPLALISVASITPVNAAIIAGWNEFNADGAAYPVSANTTDSNVANTRLTTSNIQHVTPVGSEFALGGAIEDSTDGSTGSWNTGSDLDLTQYFEFEVTPSSGFELDFTNLQLNAAMDEVNLDLTLRSSIDGFSSNLGTISLPSDDSFTTQTFDLSTLAPQSSAVQFRFYGTNASGSRVFFVGQNSVNVDGNGFVAINGDINPVNIPNVSEPSKTIGLIIISIISVISRRRYFS